MVPQELETVRKKYAKKLVIFLALAFLVFGLSVALIIVVMLSVDFDISSVPLVASPAFAVICFLGAGIIGIIAYFATRKDATAYQKLYKAHFVEKALQEVFTDLSYSHDAGMPAEALASTEMISLGDIYTSNDLTSGKYKDTSFRQADVHVQEKHTDSDGNTSYSTIFKGRWIEFEFPKAFNFRLEVAQKWFGATRVPKGKNGRKFEKFQTESPTFNKKFKIYAEDGFEVFYILDPALIDHIENLTNVHKGKFLLCFIEQKLSVAIYDNNDAFEPPNPLKSIDEAKEKTKVTNAIKLITDFVDFLRLDHKLFRK